MKYKILFSVLAILLVFLLASGTAFAAPVEIRTTDDLMKIDDSAANLSLDYILMNDIDFTGRTFMPIGNSSHPFTGTFNGNNYTISNIAFSDEEMYYVGLFGHASNAEFNDILLKNVSMSGMDPVGGLLGYGQYVSIKGCSIENREYCPRIHGKSSVGGLAGVLYHSSVSNSYAATNVTSELSGLSTHVGGLVGKMYNSSVSESYATGNVEGTGGLSSLYFFNAGGLVGHMASSSASNCYATGIAIGNFNYSFIGGFVGSMNNSTVSTSYATGNMPSNTNGNLIINDVSIDPIGDGFLGVSWNNGTVTDSFYIGSPNSNNTSKGRFVTFTELRNISTFTTVDSYLSAPWNISSSPNSNTIWYIDDGNSYPQLN